MFPIAKAAALLLLASAPLAGEELSPVRVAEDGKTFSLRDGAPFVPWGFNYDHDEQGRLIEDYWHEQWDRVAEDFAELKGLGANVVRVHLQFGKFVPRPGEPSERELARLGRLLDLAEEVGLYLDLTGLGCYHKADVPAWYDELSEEDRWDQQAIFWKAVASRAKGSPAVFCYDLMNEPVVPGGDRPQENWLGPPFGNKYFVQYITRDRGGRERPEVARRWTAKLAAAIREVDRDRLITVGLVPWSLDRPGLTSGFVPEKVAPELDFIAVHIYPESKKLDEALETLAGFDVGKPVLIEEIFPLKCSPGELAEFLDRSKPHADGCVGFYWGQTPDELAGSSELPAVITRQWLEMFRLRAGGGK